MASGQATRSGARRKIIQLLQIVVSGAELNCPGAINDKKLDAIQKVVTICLDEIRQGGLRDAISQAFRRSGEIRG
jgi:GMP synthase PP-ATPase subunit